MNHRVIKPVLFILMIFFTLQMFSHLYLKLGEGQRGGKTPGAFKTSALLMPLDAEPVYRYAYALLFEHAETKNDEMILKSIRGFEKSIRRNVLLYNTHYYLGKALFFYNQPNTPYFDRGLRAFKRAALIRGNKNINIAADTLILLLSQWPLLSDKDKIFCRDLLENSSQLMEKKNFDDILEAWRLYCRDIDFFKGIFKKNPAYYLSIAEELNRMSINLEVKQDFLAGYEAQRLDWLKATYGNYRQEAENLPARLRDLYKNSNIEGYYRLSPGSDFNEQDYLDFKKELNFHIIQLLLEQPGWKTDIEKRREIETYIFDYFNDFATGKEVEPLFELLKNNDYFHHLHDFSTAHLVDFYIHGLIQFKLGNYNRVIDEIERLRQTVAFIQTEQKKDYTRILLLLADAYVENNFLTRAMSLLEEITGISPGSLATFWRMKKIQLIIGPDHGSEREQQKEKVRMEKYRQVMNSRLIEVRSPQTRQTVYLVDSQDIVIGIDGRLKEKLTPGNLFQVYIDGKIYYEAYISQLEAQGKVEVQFEKSPAKCDVLVLIK